MPRVIASVEARMGASRLPGKMLADVCGKPALTRVLDRLKNCRLLDGIILATTTNPTDDALARLGEAEGVPVHRGDEQDVLRRVVEAQRKMSSDVVVEICGDMVLLDPEVVDWGVRMFLENDCDVLTTTCKQSFPVGVDVVVLRLQDLEQVEQTIQDQRVREHVSIHFFDHPEKYRILHLIAPPRMEAPHCRLVLDYPEDLTLFRAIYARLEPTHGERFGLEEVIALLRDEPSLLQINVCRREKG